MSSTHSASGIGIETSIIHPGVFTDGTEHFARAAMPADMELPPGTRPRRSVADGSDWGAETLNGASEELRLRLARRMNITGLLGSVQR